MGKEVSQSVIKFGEQVLAKPLRRKRTNPRVSLASKWISGTWVGTTNRSPEHLIVLPEGGGSDSSADYHGETRDREVERESNPRDIS